jgi:diguanylate cyclase
MVCVGAGQYLFRQGEAGDVAYLIEWGSVEVLVDQPFGSCRVATLGAGEIVGEMALFDGTPRSASVRTLEASTFLPITRSALERRVRASDPVVNLMLQSAFDRLRAASNRGEPKRVPERSLQMEKRAARDAVAAHLNLLHDLEDALANRQIEIFYQPIVRVCDRRIAGYEALARWRHPRRGLISPDVFIPLAETNGLTAQLSLLCVEQARNDLPRLDAVTMLCGGAPPVQLWINISGGDVIDPDYVRDLAKCAGEASNQLTLELTETSLVEERTKAAAALDLAHQNGFRVAIDDFGAGNGMMHYLRELPIDVVKIDKSFIQSAWLQPADREIMKSIVDLSASLGFATVVEGVEEPNQLELAGELGADYVQGYLLGRPVPLASIGSAVSEAKPQATVRVA